MMPSHCLPSQGNLKQNVIIPNEMRNRRERKDE
jgi:hypothetical protein